MVNENTTMAQLRCERCGRAYALVDFYYARCTECLEWIEARIALEEWKKRTEKDG